MADPCQPIPNDAEGRFSVEVTVRAPPIPAGQPGPAQHETKKKLLADTGGFTCIPFENIRQWGMKFGPVQGSNFGQLFALEGAEMVVEVEEFGRRKKELRTCPTIFIHLNGEKAFAGVNGVLGMDQFNRLSADPAKTSAGAPYLCIRAQEAKKGGTDGVAPVDSTTKTK